MTKTTNTPSSNRSSLRVHARDPKSLHDDVSEDSEIETSPARNRQTTNKRKATTTVVAKRCTHIEGELFAALKDSKCSIPQLVKDVTADLNSVIPEIMQLYYEISGANADLAKICVFGSLSSRGMQLISDDKVIKITESIARTGEPPASSYITHESLEKYMLLVIKNMGIRLLDQENQLETLLSNLMKMTSSKLRRARMYAIYFLNYIYTGICNLISSEEATLKTALIQAKSTCSRESLSATTTQALDALFSKLGQEVEKASVVEKSIQEWDKFQEKASDVGETVSAAVSACLHHMGNICKLKSIINDYSEIQGDTHSYNNIVCNRSKDIAPEIRLATLTLLQSLISKRPHNLTRLTPYLHNLLVDREAQVRQQTCDTIHELLCVNDSTVSMPKNETVNRNLIRIKERLISSALQDPDVNVIASAIRSLNSMRNFNSKLIGPDEEFAVCQNICAADTEEESLHPVREASGSFYLNNVDWHTDDDSNAEIDESNCDSSIAISKARIKFMVLVNLHDTLVGNQTDNEDNDPTHFVVLPLRAMCNLVDAFWDAPEAAFMKNWQALAEMLELYGSNTVEDHSGSYKARVLSTLLHALAIQASKLHQTVAGKKKKRLVDDKRANLLLSLHKVLGRYLVRLAQLYMSEPGVLRQLVPLFEYYQADECVTQSDTKTLTAMVETLSKLFEKHNDPSILMNIVNLYTNFYSDYLGKPAIQKIAEFAEQSLVSIMSKKPVSDIDALEWITGVSNECKRLGCIVRQSHSAAQELMISLHSRLPDLLKQMMQLLKHHAADPKFTNPLQTLFSETSTFLQLLFSWALHDHKDTSSLQSLSKTIAMLFDSLLQMPDVWAIKAALIPVFHDLQILRKGNNQLSDMFPFSQLESSFTTVLQNALSSDDVSPGAMELGVRLVVVDPEVANAIAPTVLCYLTPKVPRATDTRANAAWVFNSLSMSADPERCTKWYFKTLRDAFLRAAENAVDGDEVDLSTESRLASSFVVHIQNVKQDTVATCIMEEMTFVSANHALRSPYLALLQPFLASLKAPQKEKLADIWRKEHAASMATNSEDAEEFANGLGIDHVRISTNDPEYSIFAEDTESAAQQARSQSYFGGVQSSTSLDNSDDGDDHLTETGFSSTKRRKHGRATNPHKEQQS